MRNGWTREERVTLQRKDGRVKGSIGSLKVTGRGIGSTQIVICRLNVINRLSEMSRGFTKCFL